MHINDNHNNTNLSGRNVRRALHLGTGALLTLGLGVHLIGQQVPKAHASEFEAVPNATLEWECNIDNPIVEIHLFNSGNVPADFTITKFIDGNQSQQVEQVVTLMNIQIPVPDHTGNSFDVISNSGKGFVQHWDVAVDCVDAFTGSMQLNCPDAKNLIATLDYTVWNGNFKKVVEVIEVYPDGSSNVWSLVGHAGITHKALLQEGDHAVGSLTMNGTVVDSIDTYVDCEQDPPPTTGPPPSDPPPTTGPPPSNPPPTTGPPPSDPPPTTGPPPSNPPPTTGPPPSNPPPTTGPPPSDPPPSDPPLTGPPVEGDLPETGSNGSPGMALTAFAMLVAGGVLVLITRRRGAASQ